MRGVEKIVYLFTLLNSKKNEPRSVTAVIGLFGSSPRLPWNSLRSDSPRSFFSISLAFPSPDKGGIGVCALACILTPSSFGHSPYIPCRNTPQYYGTRQGEREIHHAPIIEGVLSFAAKHKRRGLKNHTNGVTLPPF